MGILLSNELELPLLIQESELEAALAAVLELEGVKGDAEVSVTYVDDDEMRSLNREWRGIDAPTDVLSFACDLDGEDADAPALPEEDTSLDAVIELGDIVLAPHVIAAQAPAFDTTPEEECRLMFVHGLLHLLGYDHMNEQDAAKMEERELVVLRSLARMRGEDPAQVRIGPMTRHVDD